MSSTPWTKRRKVMERMRALRSRKWYEEESAFAEEPSAMQEDDPEERETIGEETHHEEVATASTPEREDLDDLQPSPESDDSYDESSEASSDDDLGDYGFGFKEAQDIYCEWIQDMDRDDKMMLSVFLSDWLVNKLHYKVKEASGLVGSLVTKNEKTIRRWRRQFYHNVGSFPVTSQGMHNRYSVLDEEDVKEKALNWLRKCAYDKSSVGKLTAHSFLAFVNTELLPSCDLPENAPTQISLRCAYRWMHKMGFRYLRYKKGTFVDGHDREDVLEYRGMFLRKLNALESTHQPPPLPEDNLQHPFPIGNPSAQRKLVLIFHDESVFHANEDHVYSWTENGRMKLKPKGPGRGIMISDFVDEHDGFLKLSDEKFARYHQRDSSLRQSARKQLVIGQGNEGYWTNDHFLDNVKDAMKIAALKYPSDTHNVVFIFDQSSNHCAFSEDSLNAKRMNVRPGGKQPVMRTTMWNGQRQDMVDSNGVPKGLKQVLQERGINTKKLVKEQMIAILQSHDDFKHEKCRVEKLVSSFGHRVLFLPKFHCEMNPIERVWCKAKVYTRSNCDYTFSGLKEAVAPALDSVSVDDIRKYFRKARDYMHAYREGKAGDDVYTSVKQYKSHRRVFDTNS